MEGPQSGPGPCGSTGTGLTIELLGKPNGLGSIAFDS
jgi:hypothetical protein